MPGMDFKKEPDDVIVRAIRESNGEAFRTLYYRYYEPLYRFVWHRIRSEEKSKDFLQEIFTRVWITRDRLDPERSVKAYFYRIANNIIIDYIRKSASEKSYRRNVHRKQASVDHSYDLRISMEEAVNALPERIRSVFILSRYEGLKYREIAEVCEISVKTVESRMSQALKQLRDILD